MLPGSGSSYLYFNTRRTTRTQGRTNGSNLKLYIQTLSGSGCVKPIENNWNSEDQKKLSVNVNTVWKGEVTLWFNTGSGKFLFSIQLVTMSAAFKAYNGVDMKCKILHALHCFTLPTVYTTYVNLFISLCYTCMCVYGREYSIYVYIQYICV